MRIDSAVPIRVLHPEILVYGIVGRDALQSLLGDVGRKVYKMIYRFWCLSMQSLQGVFLESNGNLMGL